MAKQSIYKTEFVEHIPEVLEDGVLYVAPHHDVAMHSCMCGCGERICTPLNIWKWEFDGLTTSLVYSVENYSCSCKSHYSLLKGRVHWH